MVRGRNSQSSLSRLQGKYSTIEEHDIDLCEYKTKSEYVNIKQNQNRIICIKKSHINYSLKVPKDLLNVSVLSRYQSFYKASCTIVEILLPNQMLPRNPIY